MKSFSFVAALISVLPAVLGLTINTPSNVVVCEPQQFTWSGGAAPYYLSLVPGGQSMASPIKQFPTQSGTAYTWNVDLQAGTTFNIALKDSTGATAYSDIVTIQSGGSTSCVNTSVQEGSATAGSAPPATGGSSPATGGSSPSATTGGSTPSGSASPSSGTSASGSASPSSSSPSSNGGARLTVSSAFGVAGIMGLVGAVLF